MVSAAASQQESSGNLLMDWSLSGWSSPVNTVPAQVSSHTPKTGRLTVKFKLAAYVNVRECGFLSKCPGLAIALWGGKAKTKQKRLNRVHMYGHLAG